VPYTDFATRLIRRLEGIHNLDDADRAAIRALPIKFTELGPRQDIVREGDRPSRCCIIIDGLACWNKTSGEGKRQILSFHIAGDIPDLHSLHLEQLDSTLATISLCAVGFANHEDIQRLVNERPRIASAFWRMTLIDASIYREWVSNVGSRQAYSRIAHLLCEQVTRLNSVGLVDQNFSCSLPLTQNELGEATGLSTVHVNRSLQDLRKQALIRFEGQMLTVLDWSRLKAAGDFDQGYLHLGKAAVVDGLTLD
jgi:CRP-like cAMP-binding protein